MPWERPRVVCRADEAAFECVDALPGRWSARAPDIPPAEKRLPGSPRFCGEPPEDACENPPALVLTPPQLLRPGALAPMRHARDTNALGDTRASDSRPADGIHSSCASRTARVLESSEPGAAAESPHRRAHHQRLPAWASPSSSSTPRSTVSSPTASPGPRGLAPFRRRLLRRSPANAFECIPWPKWSPICEWWSPGPPTDPAPPLRSRVHPPNARTRSPPYTPPGADPRATSPCGTRLNIPQLSTRTTRRRNCPAVARATRASLARPTATSRRRGGARGQAATALCGSAATTTPPGPARWSSPPSGR